jgi:hypothetical protein
MRGWIADRLCAWASRLLTWSNDVRLADHRRRRHHREEVH